MNTFGTYFRITSFGESHGRAMGVVIDGCPSGVPFSKTLLQECLEKRRPGKFPWQTSRQEKDTPQVLSGVFEDKTIGTPIALLIENQNARPQDYEVIKNHPRVGHADDLWKDKFKHYDYRGGGRASGRETVSRVMGGAVALMVLRELLPDFQTLSFVDQVGECRLQKGDYDLKELWKDPQQVEKYPCYFPHKEKAEKIKELLIKAKKEGQSYGGSAVMSIKGIPKGLGRPVFHKLKADLTGALMGVGAVSGITIGGLDVSQSGNVFHKNSSVYGGIRGGLSTGEVIDLKIFFKPPSSLGERARKGRHDPCVIPRAVPVLESMVYLVLLDHLLAQRLDCLKEDTYSSNK